MTEQARAQHLEQNRKALAAELDDIADLLAAHAAGAPLPTPPPRPAHGASALDELCDRLRLSSFERRVLLMAAGMELDGRFPQLCNSGAGPSLALALSAMPDPHWGVLSPSCPLRHWRLVEISAGVALVHGTLRIDPSILGHLLGQTGIDPRLEPLTDPLPRDTLLAPSQSRLADHLALLWKDVHGSLPVLQLVTTGDSSTAVPVGIEVCNQFGLQPLLLSAAALPADTEDLETVIRLSERSSVLDGCVVMLLCDEPEEADAAREAVISRVIERLDAPLVLCGRKRRRGLGRTVVSFDVRRASAEEQRHQWHDELRGWPGAARLARRMAAQFDLSPGMIAAVCADARTETDPADPGDAVWDAARRQARPRLDDLAQRIEPHAGWDDLVLPEAQRTVLRAIEAQVAHRATVHGDWGFGSDGERGQGLATLFAGSSGTGKTTAAEVLARGLKLDLYRVDLSQVVSKFIGETEKNLRRVFDAAEAGGVILLFDEADALFAKRTQVNDSHDRYANLEVSYLLQRVEAFRGLAILTTNMKASVDTAFLRRLRFIVTFPFPDATIRAEIWRRVFPKATPVHDLDYQRLAQLNLSGGQIRMVAMNAAFMAVAAGREAVGMADIRAAAMLEYAKQEKVPSDAELKGWPA